MTMMAAIQAEISETETPVIYHLDEYGVATLALNRPNVRNAIDDELIGNLLAGFRKANDDPAVRCVVLTSTHDSVFSAGGNLKGMAAIESTIAKHERNSAFPALTETIMGLKAPVLCALNGHALAGGFGLALACDLIIAKAGLRIGTPEINVGVFPFMISTLMQRNIPRKRMTELILLGEQMTVEEAHELNIINRVVPAELFDETVRDWSRRLAAKSPLMMKLGKRALFETQDQPLMQALSQLSHYLTLAQCSEDIKEGVAAFVEKRAPVWKGA